MPALYKYREGRSKAALLSTAKNLLPASILDRRDKMGFPVPFAEWVSGPLRDFVGDIMLGTAAKQRGIYRPEGIEALLGNERRYGRALWGMLCLETWFQTFVDGGALAARASPEPIQAAAPSTDIESDE